MESTADIDAQKTGQDPYTPHRLYLSDRRNPSLEVTYKSEREKG